jgi:hypothetical protein
MASQDPDGEGPVIQMAAKLVVEPIFEADFQPSSDGFRRRGVRHKLWKRSAKRANGLRLATGAERRLFRGGPSDF